jgi:hypothetical protein
MAHGAWRMAGAQLAQAARLHGRLDSRVWQDRAMSCPHVQWISAHHTPPNEVHHAMQPPSGKGGPLPRQSVANNSQKHMQCSRSHSGEMDWAMARALLLAPRFPSDPGLTPMHPDACARIMWFVLKAPPWREGGARKAQIKGENLEV